MLIEFDPAKDAINMAKHGISLARAADLEGAIVLSDAERFDEPRYRVYGYIDGRLYCAAAVDRGDIVRVISLRRARLKEYRRYVR